MTGWAAWRDDILPQAPLCRPVGATRILKNTIKNLIDASDARRYFLTVPDFLPLPSPLGRSGAHRSLNAPKARSLTARRFGPVQIGPV